MVIEILASSEDLTLHPIMAEVRKWKRVHMEGQHV
jgi:hypothetical protein